jgi:predicted O-methyltransferase YrrM
METALDLVHPSIDRYLLELAEPDDKILREMAGLARERDFPFVGPQVGRLLYTLATAIGARRVLELGSGFGYSAYWFARAVGAAGEVILTEGSGERVAEAADFLRQGGFAERTRILQGDALELIDDLGSGFDIVFNDIDKHDYPRVLDKVRKALRPGGLFISDNMLWMGKVLDERTQDTSTQGVLELTRMLHQSADFSATLIPMRDGVTVAHYRP